MEAVKYTLNMFLGEEDVPDNKSARTVYEFETVLNICFISEYTLIL